jgi:hypothetical protein
MFIHYSLKIYVLECILVPGMSRIMPVLYLIIISALTYLSRSHIFFLTMFVFLR